MSKSKSKKAKRDYPEFPDLLLCLGWVASIPMAPFDKLRNDRRIREISCPLLVIHGEADGVIPIWHGRKLYDLAPVPKQCWWVPHAGHNDIVTTDAQGYWSHIRAFRDWVVTLSGKG